MQIVFKTNRLEKRLSSDREIVRTWGNDNGQKIKQRMAEFQAAKCLGDMYSLPCRCHELHGDRDGQLSVDLKHPSRLVFELANNPIPRKVDGGIDPSRITAIRILEVVDYHG
jgi:plasmid maintenance system killer protein